MIGWRMSKLNKVPFKDYLTIEDKFYKYKEHLEKILTYLNKNQPDKAIRYAKRKKLYE